MSNRAQLPANTTAHYETLASEEEIYLEEIEEELRAQLIALVPDPRALTNIEVGRA